MGKKRKPINEFSHGYRGWQNCSWARTHDDGVGQDGGHNSNNSLTETCRTHLLCISLILEIDTCQSKVSADLYHVTISWAQVFSLGKVRFFLGGGGKAGVSEGRVISESEH